MPFDIEEIRNDLIAVQDDIDRLHAAFCDALNAVEETAELPQQKRSILSSYHQIWKENYPEEPLNLREANLQNAQLRGALLKDADLEGADLRWADMEEISLTRANLTNVNLQGANLTEAIFQGADLTNAQLQGTNLKQAILLLARLNGAQLQGAYLPVVMEEGATFNNADVTDAIIRPYSPILEKLTEEQLATAITTAEKLVAKIEEITKIPNENITENIKRVLPNLYRATFDFYDINDRGTKPVLEASRNLIAHSPILVAGKAGFDAARNQVTEPFKGRNYERAITIAQGAELFQRANAESPFSMVTFNCLGKIFSYVYTGNSAFFPSPEATEKLFNNLFTQVKDGKSFADKIRTDLFTKVSQYMKPQNPERPLVVLFEEQARQRFLERKAKADNNVPERASFSEMALKGRDGRS